LRKKVLPTATDRQTCISRILHGKLAIKLMLFGDRKDALLLLGFIVCALCYVAPTAPVQAAEPLRIEDRWPEIFRLLGTSSLAAPEKAIRLVDYLRKTCPEIADRLHIGEMTRGDSERYLAELEQRSFAIRSLARRFAAIHSDVEERFIQAFPDFRPSRITVYLTVSRFRFDGKVPHDHWNSLLFAFDGVAKFHGGNAPVAVIFSHELFHLYHFQISPPPADPDQVPLYRLIWQEGLACYVSGLLNPSAPFGDILFDPRLAAEGPKFVKSVSRQLLRDLQSTDDVETAEYLTYRTTRATPPRMGYLIGYQIVANLATLHSLTELAHLRDPELRFIMRRELRRLAEQH
jgi:plasmid stabilization system protein ParE